LTKEREILSKVIKNKQDKEVMITKTTKPKETAKET
jgi:hypothetical protein